MTCSLNFFSRHECDERKRFLGWTDPQTGKEYALVGLNNGCAFIDISNLVNPVYLGKLTSNGSGSGDSWRDVKVYQNHAS